MENLNNKKQEQNKSLEVEQQNQSLKTEEFQLQIDIKILFKKYRLLVLVLIGILIIFGVVLGTNKESNLNSENYSYVISPLENENCKYAGYDIDCVAQLLLKDEFGQTKVVVENVYDIFEDSSYGTIEILDFSNDLERILFFSSIYGGGRVYLYDVSSGEYQLVTSVDFVAGSKISPDGNKVSKIANEKKLSVIDLWTEAESTLVSLEDSDETLIEFISSYGGDDRANYSWSDDSKGVCYYVYDSNESVDIDEKRTPIDYRCTEDVVNDEIDWSGHYELRELTKDNSGFDRTWVHKLKIEKESNRNYKVNLQTDGHMLVRSIDAAGEVKGDVMNVYFVADVGHTKNTPTLKERDLLFTLTPSARFRPSLKVNWAALNPISSDQHDQVFRNLFPNKTVIEGPELKGHISTFRDAKSNINFSYPSEWGRYLQIKDNRCGSDSDEIPGCESVYVRFENKLSVDDPSYDRGIFMEYRNSISLDNPYDSLAHIDSLVMYRKGYTDAVQMCDREKNCEVVSINGHNLARVTGRLCFESVCTEIEQVYYFFTNDREYPIVAFFANVEEDISTMVNSFKISD